MEAQETVFSGPASSHAGVLIKGRVRSHESVNGEESTWGNNTACSRNTFQAASRSLLPLLLNDPSCSLFAREKETITMPGWEAGSLAVQFHSTLVFSLDGLCNTGL